MAFRTTTLAAAMGAALTAALLLGAGTRLWDVEERELRTDSALAGNLVVEKLSASIEGAENLSLLFSSSEKVTTEEFRRFTTPILNRHRHILLAAYLPRVSEGAAAGSPPWHFPLFFIEQIQPVQTLPQGLDLAGYAELVLAIRHAILDGHGVFAPLSRPEWPVNALMIQPVYLGKAMPDTPEDREKLASGLIVLGVDTGQLLDVDAAIDADTALELRYHQPDTNGWQTIGAVAQPVENAGLPPIRLEEILPLRNLDFRLTLVKTPELKDIHWEMLLLALLSGGFLTALLVDLIAAHQRETARLARQNEQTQREIARQTSMFRQVLATIPVRVFWKGRDGRYLGCNPLFAHDAGLEAPEQIIGKTDHDLAWRAQATDYQTDDQRVLQSGQPRLGYEEPQTGPGGEELWLETSKIPLANEDGDIIGVLGTYKDITLRKQAEALLKKNAERAQRFNDTLLRLFQAGFDGLEACLRRLNEETAHALGVERIGFWVIDAGPPVLRCRDLYTVSSGAHQAGAGVELSEDSAYLKAVRGNTPVAADDACTDPRTRELAEGYLHPFGIASLLDAPVWFNGAVYGVLCCEHIGSVRHWNDDEVDFLERIAALLSIALVTEQRAGAEQSLRDSQARLAEAQRIAHIGHWRWDIHSDSMVWSEEICRIFGLEGPCPPLSSGAVAAFTHPEDRERVAQAAAQALQGDGRYQVQHRIVRTDGGERVVEEIGVVRRDEDGAPIALEGTLQDVTERMKIQEDLELYRLMIEKTADPVFLIDIDDGFRMAYLNEAAVKHYGAPREEILTWRIPDWDPNFSVDDLPAHLEAIKQHPGLVIETVHRRKNGELVPVEVSLNLVRYKGRLCHFGYFKSIGERKETERRLLEAKAQAESAAAMKSAFLANMSHEIRTPMNAIINFNRLALQTSLDAKQRDYLEKSLAAGRVLLGIINDVLDFSKIEAGKLEFESLPFSLDETLRQLLDTLGANLGKKPLRLDCRIDPATPRLLVGDPLRLGQVLTNLAGNAIKFTETGSVDIGVEPLAQDSEQATLRFHVKDTGIGISPEQTGRLFQSFSQADDTITRKFGGTGLGLAISKKLVELMDGEISVASVPGQGSTFSFTARFGLTKALPQRDAPAEAASSPPAIGGARILLVEDNDINQEIVLELLSGQGLEVVVADNGRLALDALAKENFDLVLMDLQMPEMDGYQAARAIRADPRRQNLPIIAMTANAMRGDKEKCLEAGMNGHIAKPIDPDQLYAALRQWLQPGSPRPPLAVETIPAQGEDSLPECLDGFDMQAGLGKVAGNRALYARLLAKFRDNNRDSVAKLHQALASNDTAAARALAHTVRGVAGNLGATPLAVAAAGLENEIGLAGCAVSVDEFVERLEQTLTALHGIAPPVAKHAAAADRSAAAGAAPLLMELRDNLEKNYPQSMRCLDALRPLLQGTSHEPALLGLDNALADFDIESARTQAECIIGQLP